MQPDPALAGETRDSRQLLRVKRLPRHPPHRRFDRDRADRNGDAHPRCAGGSSLDFGQADRRTAGRERHKRRGRSASARNHPRRSTNGFLPEPARVFRCVPGAAPQDGWPGSRWVERRQLPCRAASPSSLRVRRPRRRTSSHQCKFRGSQRFRRATAHIHRAIIPAHPSGTAPISQRPWRTESTLVRPIIATTFFATYEIRERPSAPKRPHRAETNEARSRPGRTADRALSADGKSTAWRRHG